MKVQKITQYVAFDGAKFDNEPACKKHEETALPERFAGLSKDQVVAALNRTDPDLAEAFERFAAQITKARLKAGGSRRKRKAAA